MSRHRPGRRLAAAASGLLVVALAGLSGAAPAAAARTAKPGPESVPKAVSRVGGDQLISPQVLTDLPTGVPTPSPPKATSWLVADLDARTVLAGHRVHVPLAPASTLKIFTALALAPELTPDTKYTGKDADAAIDGTKVGIVPGSTYTVDDLLHGMLMGSGNDCANALGTLVGGTAAATALMTAQARELGAFDTVARNTSGLDAKGQVSSAYDLALAGSAALADKQLAKIMKTTAYEFPGAGKDLGAKRSRFQTQNHNRLLGSYDGAVGVKNGFTTAARGSFVGAATRDGHTYLAVVMRAEGSTSRAAADLLDWAFAHGTEANPVGILVEPGEVAPPAVSADTDSAAVTTTSTSAAAPDPGNDAPATTGTTGSRPLRGALPAGSSTVAQSTGPGRTSLLGAFATLLVLSTLTVVLSRRGRSRYPTPSRHRF